MNFTDSPTCRRERPLRRAMRAVQTERADVSRPVQSRHPDLQARRRAVDADTSARVDTLAAALDDTFGALATEGLPLAGERQGAT